MKNADDDAEEPLEELEGELCIQTVAMPADTNPSGDIFAGWLLA